MADDTEARHVKLQECLPDFCEELQHCLTAMGEEEHFAAISDLSVASWDYCQNEDVGYIYLSGQRSLNVVEVNVIKPRYDYSLEVDAASGMVILDFDNFGRIVGIEIINRRDIKVMLENSQVPSNHKAQDPLRGPGGRHCD